MEATTGFEPVYSGFADRRVNHFTTWPGTVTRVPYWVKSVTSLALTITFSASLTSTPS